VAKSEVPKKIILVFGFKFSVCEAQFTF